MLNLTQGITVKTKHVFFFHKNDLQSGFSGDWGRLDWGLGTGKSIYSIFSLIQASLIQASLIYYGSTQRSSALIKLINSSTPLSSGTFLISSLPR